MSRILCSRNVEIRPWTKLKSYEYVSSILIANEESALIALNSSIQDQVDSVINDLDITSANINYSSLMSDNLDASFNLEISETNLPIWLTSL